MDAVALRIFLDGDRREVREHVRAVLARPEFSRPAEPLPTEEYRERVSEWTRTLASTGGPALLFPEEFGGLGRVGDAIAALRDARPLRPLAAGQVRGPVRPLRRRGPPPRHPLAPRALPEPDRDLRAAGRLRDERVGPRLERAERADPGHLRRRDAGVRGHDADRGGPQGLHRQRRPRRADGGGLLPARRRRRASAACTASWSRSATRAARSARACGSRTAATSSASTASTTGASTSTTCGCRARTCSTATRRSAPRASTRARSRTRTGASSRCSAP